MKLWKGSESDEALPARRRVLSGMVSATGVSAAALLGMNTVGPGVSAQVVNANASDDLLEMARFRNYKVRRSSSWDRTGGNRDAVPVEPGATVAVLEANGAGVVNHLWFTISSQDPMHLKNLVLRAWWDGESSPSIEAPIGDFFGLGLGEYFVYQSALLVVAPVKALNAYFQMPFSSGARITVTNEGSIRTNALYYAIDYAVLSGLPFDVGRFHAQYRQAAPCKGWTTDWVNNGSAGINERKDLDGKDNYVFFEAAGRGHFIGVAHAVLQNQNGWFGEGDDMIFIDGDTMPTINGTGSEDYYNGAWDFGLQAFANLHQGAPYVVDPERIGGRYCLYRWHVESPITFEKSIRVTIEHGHANHRSDNFYSVGYWYQTEPHADFQKLPAAEQRTPKLFDPGGGAAPAPMAKD